MRFLPLILSLFSFGAAELAALPDNTVRPNILLIVADDQRYGTVGEYMPNVQSRIFDQGRVFDQAYITTAACCPSRSSMYTGLYASGHGVHLNGMKLSESKPTFIKALHANGYFTGIVGKFVTSQKGIPRPEFNYWISFRHGSVAYFNPLLNVNGVISSYRGYITDLLRDGAMEFLHQAEAQTQPFLMIFSPNAPHSPSIPESSTVEMYKSLESYRPRSFNSTSGKGNPNWIRSRGKLSAANAKRVDGFRQNQLRTLWSLDHAVGTLLNELEGQGLLDKTVVIYISDNGIMWGEHGLISKECIYEQAIHVPLAIRYPGLVTTPSINRDLVANIDIAPTIYELAQIPSTPAMHGRSLVPLLREDALQSSTGWRTELVIEGYRDDDAREPFRALHTGRLKYVQNASGDTQLYDLSVDPNEMINFSGRRTYREEEAQLKKTFIRTLAKIDSHWSLHRKSDHKPRTKITKRKTARSTWWNITEEEDTTLVLPRAQERWLRHKYDRQ